MPFAPSDLSGLKVWLKGDAGLGGLADNDPISTWADQSGGSHDFTSTSTARPLYKTSARNSLPGVLFDGSNDILQGGNLSAQFPSAATVFVVYDADASGNSGINILANNGNDAWWKYDSGLSYMGLFRTTRLALKPYMTPPWVGPHQVCVISNATNYRTYADKQILGTDTADFSAGTVMNLGAYATGTSQRNLKGYVYEVIMYDSTLSDVDRQSVQNYLATKWDLDRAADTGAPSGISGLKLWLKASKITGKSDGDTVSYWPDASGMARDWMALTSGTTTWPLYKTSVVGSEPSVRFDGSNDALYAMGNLGEDYPSAAHCFVVMKPNTDTAYTTMWNVANTDTWRWTDNTGYTGFFRQTRINNYPTTPAPPSSGTFLWELKSSGSTYQYIQDGKAATAQSASYPAIGNYDSPWSMGLIQNPFDGDVLEVIFFNTVLSDENKFAVESYLLNKYGLDNESGTAIPSNVVGTGAVPTAVATGPINGTAAPATVAGVGAVPAATGKGNAATTPAAVVGTGLVPASAALGASVAAPDRVAGTGAVPASTGQGDAAVVAPVVVGAGAVPAATAFGTAAGVATPAATVGVGLVPAPSVSGPSVAAPDRVAGMGAVPAPTAKGASTAAPATVAGVGAVPVPTASAVNNAIATPGAAAGAGRVPGPTFPSGIPVAGSTIVLTTSTASSDILNTGVVGNLITNGTFDANIAGWTDTSGAPSLIAWSSSYGGSMHLDGTVNYARANQSFPTVVGQAYYVSLNMKLLGGGEYAKVFVGTTQANNDVLDATVNAAGLSSFAFTAVGTTTWLQIWTGYNQYVDDIIVAKPHGLVAGQSIEFVSLTGGTGLSLNQPYYVLASNLGSTTFQVSLTPGGSAVDFTTDITSGLARRVIVLTTSAAADDILDATGPHGLTAGQSVEFVSLTGGAGLSRNQQYYVLAASLGSTTFKVSLTPGGAAVNFTTDVTAGSVRLNSFAFSDVSVLWVMNIKDADGSVVETRSAPFRKARLNWTVENAGGGAAEIDVQGSDVPAWTAPRRLVIRGERDWSGELSNAHRSGKPVDVGVSGEAGWTVSALGLIHRLDYRIVRHVFVVNDNADVIVHDLLDEAQLNQNNGNMGFHMGDVHGTTVVRERDYCFGVGIGDAIRELAAIGRGFDWEIDADQRLNIWNGSRGIDTGRTLSESQCQNFDIDYDTAEMLTTVSALADPSDPFGPRHRMSRTGKADDFGRRETAIDTDVISDIDTNPNYEDELYDAADALLKTDGGAFVTVKAMWSSNKAPWSMADVWLQDNVTVSMPDPLAVTLGSTVEMRVTDVTVTIEPMPPRETGPPIYWIEYGFAGLVRDIDLTRGDVDGDN